MFCWKAETEVGGPSGRGDAQSRQTKALLLLLPITHRPPCSEPLCPSPRPAALANQICGV